MNTTIITPEEVRLYRKETAGCSNVIHLNNAGAALMPDVVTKSILDHINLEAAVGGYEAAAREANGIQEFYNEAAKLLNCQVSNIAFTASATDSYTRALSSIPFKPGDVILTSNDDFISNQIQFLACEKRFGVKIIRVNSSIQGGVDLDDLDKKLRTLRPRLLAITHIPTNSGLVQPVLEIGKIVNQYHDTWYLLDACQSIGQMKLDVKMLKCDFLSVTNRKFLRGPRGAGFLYVSDKALDHGLEPLFIDMRGADWIAKDQYRANAGAIRFEDWEFAYALVLGTRHAISYCLRVGEDRIWERVKELSNYIRIQLAEINTIRVLDKGPELGALVTFTVKDSDPHFLVQELQKRSINVVPSYRKFAVIDFEEKNVDWALRASPHYYNTIEEIDMFIDAVKELVI